jgi:hypothetical protein
MQGAVLIHYYNTLFTSYFMTLYKLLIHQIIYSIIVIMKYLEYEKKWLWPMFI